MKDVTLNIILYIVIEDSYISASTWWVEQTIELKAKRFFLSRYVHNYEKII